ncbi:hypothetical protein D3C77_587480 [compost metagenome]
MGTDATEQFDVIITRNSRVGVSRCGQVERKIFIDVSSVADVVVEFGATAIAHAAAPDAHVNTTFVGYIQAALDSGRTVQCTATVQPVGCQGGGHADIEFADRTFDGFRDCHAAEGNR